MTKIIKAAAKMSEQERLDIISKHSGLPVKELQTRVDELIDKVMRGEAMEVEEHRAAILAKIILDRTPKEN